MARAHLSPNSVLLGSAWNVGPFTLMHPFFRAAVSSPAGAQRRGEGHAPARMRALASSAAFTSRVNTAAVSE